MPTERRARSPRRLLLLAAVFAAACAPVAPGPEPSPEVRPGRDHEVRVAIRNGVATAVVSATGAWFVTGGGAADGPAARGEQLTISARGGELRVLDERGREHRLPGALAARTTGDAGLLTVDGRRYRGRLVVHALDDRVLVVNHLLMQDYLRGVVPLEIGPRTAHERAAVEAQAITARSYARVRLRPESATRYDLVANVTHQVYGGADAETPLSDDAVRATDGLVLTYAGRIVDAVYHSTCGGSTAAASEVWRSEDLPYLRPVSDRIGNSDRHYCDISPRFRWTREIARDELAALLQRYLRDYADVPAGGPGTPTAAEVGSRTTTGRVGTLVIVTDRGRFTLRGNDIRFVLRDGGGGILGSTYFSLENASEGGRLAGVRILGSGFGHGIGMCQWGAIGRARAGHSARTILGTYYPGTRVEMVN